MPAPNTIPADKLLRLLGLARTPAIIDVRSDEAFADDPRLIPGAVRRPASAAICISSSIDPEGPIIFEC